ncbi:hypothetical protein [Roseateles amylovorans]|uniref:Type 4b pilus protein PilO2 n=1 Tax=Roseateles amylovorans TaxID=2978473 RepID=A0ABY6B685_9BURK|nr:hypothetical protein [Roseateles amylovorans]UXH80276.1 hypothetical protein N4261_10540 [Roseateles amylovorans]
MFTLTKLFGRGRRDRPRGDPPRGADAAGDADDPRAPGHGPGSVARTATVAGVRLAFDLDWSPVEDASAPGPELQRARKIGYNYAAMLPDGRLVGLAKGIQAGPGRPHSAVVLLIERFSSGGAEACVIGIGKQVAFIGLMDRRPVPGFDRLLNSLDAALGLLREFREIHIDQNVRLATNLTDQIANAESLQLNAMFEMPEAASLVRPLINRALIRTVVGGTMAALVVGGSVGGMLWKQHQQRLKDEAAARQAYENDPNRIYENKIDSMLASMGQPGNALLSSWRGILQGLPLSREGWTLQRVECTRVSQECLATWHRNYGNFNDFDAKATGSALSSAGGGQDGDLLKSAITTRHPVQVPRALASAASGALPTLPSLQREHLPLEKDATTLWGSRLQDLTLVASGGGGSTSTTLRPGQLFGPPQVRDIKVVKRPVVSMEWRLVDNIWSLPSIDLPDTAVPDNLTVQLSAGQVTYTLSGSIYAKGKPY